MPKRKITVILLLGLSFFAGLKCRETLSKLDEIGEPLLTTVKFENDAHKDTVYLVTKRWGLTGDHQVFALTKTEPVDNHWQPNRQKDLIWQGDNSLFYQQENDTIKIFTMQLPDKTQEMETNQIIQIQQIDGETYDKLRKQVDTVLKVME